MTSKRLYWILLGVVALLVLALPLGAYGINSLLTSEADKLTAQKAKNQALIQEQAVLTKAKKDIAKYSDLEKITQSVVPEDKNQAEAVREIVRLASANGIGLGSITFPVSTLGSSPTGAVITPAPSIAPKSAAGAKTLSQLQPVKNISGVYQLLITVGSDTNNPVPYNQFVSFLSDLEHNRRTAQVSSITLQPDNKDRNLLGFTLTLTEYIKP